MYVLVYSPAGEPFEVTRDRADQLLLQEGWTQTPPVMDEKPEPPKWKPMDRAPFVSVTSKPSEAPATGKKKKRLTTKPKKDSDDD